MHNLSEIVLKIVLKDKVKNEDINDKENYKYLG